MPELVELHQDWRARGVRVQTVSLDLVDSAQVKTAEQLGAFVERRGIALPVAAFTGDIDGLIERYGLPPGPPCTLLFDRAGREVARIEGPGEKAEFEALLTGALAR